MQLIDEQITPEKTRQVFDMGGDTFVKLHTVASGDKMTVTGSLCGVDGVALQTLGGEPWIIPHVQTVTFVGDHVTPGVIEASLSMDRAHVANLVVQSIVPAASLSQSACQLQTN